MEPFWGSNVWFGVQSERQTPSSAPKILLA
jgi:hypothetical protein